jgi:CheY-like chemotaxis protein
MRPQESILPGPISENSPKFIVIGEDDKDDEELLKEIFNSIDNSFSIVFVNTGQQVLTYLQNLRGHLPCLILLDYNMPVLNGADILEALKKDPRYNRVPKVIWSTSTSETFKKICLQAGANEYMVKPSNITELTEMIRHMISFC